MSVLQEQGRSYHIADWGSGWCPLDPERPKKKEKSADHIKVSNVNVVAKFNLV